MKKILILIIFFFLGQWSFAQDKVTIAKAENGLKTLREGFLLVTIPTYHKKIAFLNDELKKFEKDERYTKRLIKQKNKIVKEADSTRIKLAEGLKKYYDFSTVVLAYDTLNTKYFDVDLQEKKDFSLQNKSFLTCKRMLIFTNENKPVADAFVIVDGDNKEIFEPFIDMIPVNFRRLKVLRYDKDNFTRVSEEEYKKYKKWKKSKKMDRNKYIAIVKMLNLKLTSMNNLIEFGR